MLPVTIRALVTKLQATRATGLARTQSLDKLFSLTGKTVFFTIATLFPTRRLDTPHTQRDSCYDERCIRLPGYDPSTFQSPQRLTLISEASQSLNLK